jgi:hypothetical protein
MIKIDIEKQILKLQSLTIIERNEISDINKENEKKLAFISNCN